MTYDAAEAREPVTIPDVTVLRETQTGMLRKGAIHVQCADGRRAWIPKSLVGEDSEAYKAETQGALVIPRWLAAEKGLL